MLSGGSTLQGLLPELLVQIAGLLDDPSDFCALRSASKAFRASLGQDALVTLISARWGCDAVPEDRSQLRTLIHLYGSKFNYILSADALTGAWTDNDSYFQRLAGGRCGSALCLKHVWWLSVGCTFTVGGSASLAASMYSCYHVLLVGSIMVAVIPCSSWLQAHKDYGP